uniref:PKD_channel domain-containing protein n=2 Tax=Bursaphelenchus xylophilus TaxID=6326 RepID=A0A1I7RXD7_BURXY
MLRPLMDVFFVSVLIVNLYIAVCSMAEIDLGLKLNFDDVFEKYDDGIPDSGELTFSDSRVSDGFGEGGAY